MDANNVHAMAEEIAQAITGDAQFELPALIGKLMAANFGDYTLTLNQHIESLERDLAGRTTELAAIRSRINELFSGPYMPNQEAIILAVFYPSKEAVKQCREQRGAG